MLVIRADGALADIGRRGAAEYVLPEVRKGERVWFDGGWGFQWYAMQAGARPMTFGPPLPVAGDVVVVGLTGGPCIAQCPKRRLLRQWIVADRGGRVLGDGAGFFSNGSGALPWAWGESELGRVEVWKIE